MASKIKTLYDQGSALMTPENSEATSMAANQKSLKEANDATRPTLIITPAPTAPVTTSPNDVVGMGGYGSRPGERRIDTSFPETSAPAVTNPREQLMSAPVAYHEEGGTLDKDKINVVGENGPEEIIGDEVVPLNHTSPNQRMAMPDDTETAPANFGGAVYPNPGHMKAKWDTEKPEINQTAPMNMENARPEEDTPGKPSMMQETSNKINIPQPVTSPDKAAAEKFVQGLPGTASPEERKAAIDVPNDGMMKSRTLQNMDAASAGARQKQMAEPTPAPPDPNQILADQHAKVMKAKLDAASKGDMVGLGSAIIAGQTLGTAGPQATTAAEGGQAPTTAEANLAPGTTGTPAYTGQQRIGAGTPGEAQAQQDYKAKIADLDKRIVTASQIHTPEGKQELGYLQSEKAVLQKMNPLGSAANKPGALGKIEHGLGVVGNIAGNALIPNVMPSIPGSEANIQAKNEEGVANVEQGQSDALKAAQADKAQQTPPVKPQDQLAQEKLGAQTKLGQITAQLQDPKTTPEQKAALQQQAEQIYAGNPEFRPKPEDQAKQAVGDQGVQQHEQQLDAIANAAEFTPEQAANQKAAYGIKPTDTPAIAEKKLADAKSVAQLDSSRRDRQTARDAATAAKGTADQEKQDKANDARMDKSYQYNRTRLDKFRKPVEDMNGRLAGLQAELDQNTPMSDALIAPKLLTLMTGGQGTGMRMNEAEISRLVGGRSHWETLKADINKWSLDPSKANSITPEQRKEIRALTSVVGHRLQRQLDLVDGASNDLTAAATPADHRRVVDEITSKLSRAGEGKVRVQVPGHPPGDIPEDKVEQFRKDSPDGQVLD